MKKIFSQRTGIYLFYLITYGGFLSLGIGMLSIFIIGNFPYIFNNFGIDQSTNLNLLWLYITVILTIILVSYQFILKRSDKVIILNDRLIYNTLGGEIIIPYNDIKDAKLLRGVLTEHGVKSGGKIAASRIPIQESYRYLIISFTRSRWNQKISFLKKPPIVNDELIIEMSKFKNGKDIPSTLENISGIKVRNIQLSNTKDAGWLTDEVKKNETEKKYERKINVIMGIILVIIFIFAIIEKFTNNFR